METTIDGGVIDRSMPRFYDAYGLRMASVETVRSGYVGALAERDLGWYELGHRFYVPSLRRFISPDPISPLGAGGFNRYAYCAGDPINRIDPAGNAWSAWLKNMVSAIYNMRGMAVAEQTFTPSTAKVVSSGVADIASRSAGVSIAANAVETPIAKHPARSASNPSKGLFDELLGLINHGQPRMREAVHFGGTVHVHEGSGWESQRRLRREAGYVETWLGLRQQSEYEAVWHRFKNPNGAFVHLADGVVTPSDVFERVSLHINNEAMKGRVVSASDLVVLAGAHGRSDGRNWSKSGRWAGRRDSIDEVSTILESMVDNGFPELGGLNVENVGAMTSAEYRQLIAGDRMVFGGVCFLAADELAMRTLNYPFMQTFILNF